MEFVAGDTESQEALSEALNVAFRLEVLETVMVWFGGLLAPCTALYVRPIWGVMPTAGAAEPSEASLRQTNTVIRRTCQNDGLAETWFVRRDCAIKEYLLRIVAFSRQLMFNQIPSE